jgi:tetratricopeptide (TPR) repeat protein
VLSARPLNPDGFLEAVQPLLEARDVHALTRHLQGNYHIEQLCGLLASTDADVCKVAALALGLVGDRTCIDCLADRLADPDPVINQMAEHALWNVWFRSGSPQANLELCQGAQALNQRDFQCAIDHFDRALELCFDFAEAHHQRGMAWYLLEEHEQAIADYTAAVILMPNHFCAWAGLGHSNAHLERIPQAIEAYERAREINPHLKGIAQALGDLRHLAQRRASRPTD